MKRASELLGSRNTAALRVRLLPVVPEKVEVRPVSTRIARLWPQWVAAMTMPWAIYVRPDVIDGDPDRLAAILVHELVHSRQWKTHGLLGFLRHYLVDYGRGRLRRLGHKEAYQAIPLEAEAHEIASLL